MKAEQIFEQVTGQIVKAIEEGGLDPWQVPWRNVGGLPTNATTHVAYKGGNVLVLWLTQQIQGYPTAEWLTYKQAESIGAHVRKGEHGTHLIKWSVTRCKGTSADHRCEKCGRLVPFGFVVFNVAQVDGYEAPAIEDGLSEAERLDHADAFFDAVGSDVRHGGDRAFYAQVGDFIQIPEFAQFTEPADYYSTLGHEHVHWTGHKARCDRTFGKRFGDDLYAAEELVAEIGSAFLCATLGITNTPRADHASYLAHWLKVLKAEPRALYEAASKAQKAVDFLTTKVEALSPAAA